MTHAIPAVGPNATQVKVKQIEAELRHEFLEREDHVEAFWLALLSANNGIAFGEPGTGKSLLLETLCRCITDAKYGRWLMDRQMDKSELVGMFDLPAYEKTGVYSRNITDTLLDCNIGFFDEVGKTGPGVTTPLLTAINEHIGKPAGEWIDLPIITAFGATNEELDPDQAAFEDRFLIKLVFDRLKSDDNVMALLRSATNSRAPQVRTTITLAELRDAIDNQVPHIEVPDSVLQAVTALRRELETEGFFPSDRRLRACVRVLQAKAWMEGRDVVLEDDIAVLRHILWDRMEHRTKVARLVLGHTGPVTRASLTLMTAITELTARIQVLEGESLEDRAGAGGRMLGDIKELEAQIAKVRTEAVAKGRDTSRLTEVDHELSLAHVQVYVRCMNTPEAAARRMIGV